MKILFVTHQFFPLHHTGTERLTLDLAKQLKRMGHYVSVLTYEPSSILEKVPNSNVLYRSGKKDLEFKALDKHIERKEYQIETIPVISFKHTKFKLGFEIFDSYLEKHLLDIVKNFDIVHFTHPMRFGSIITICKKLNIPTVLTLTDCWLLCPRALITTDKQLCSGPNEGKNCMELCHYDEKILSRYKDTKFFFENIDKVFSGSKFAGMVFWENGWQSKISLNTFAVDYSYIKSVDNPRELVFSFIGTLDWHKGPHVLIEAFKKVEDDSIKLKIFGRGEEKNPYIQYIMELGKNDKRIEFCGTFDYKNIPKIMEQISVLVIPSNYKENFPLVMQLGLAYKKPIIASEIGGIPEVIKDRSNGFLFEVGRVEQLKRIIQDISENPKILEHIIKTIKSPPRIEEEAFNYELAYRELHNKK